MKLIKLGYSKKRTKPLIDHSANAYLQEKETSTIMIVNFVVVIKRHFLPVDTLGRLWIKERFFNLDVTPS